jgi:shikimate kinase
LATKHFFLTGYRGCGKSSVGRIVAKNLTLPFRDTDDEIESEAGCSIADIFSAQGEQAFRDLESKQLEKVVSSSSATVISLGGGTVLRETNRNLIKQSGCTVWLRASPETIFERIAGDAASQSRRPKLSALGDLDEIRKVLELRLQWYREVASFSIETDGLKADQIAATIVSWVRDEL